MNQLCIYAFHSSMQDGKVLALCIFLCILLCFVYIIVLISN